MVPDEIDDEDERHIPRARERDALAEQILNELLVDPLDVLRENRDHGSFIGRRPFMIYWDQIEAGDLAP